MQRNSYSHGKPSTKRGPNLLSCGRYWDRTSDLFRVSYKQGVHQCSPVSENRRNSGFSLTTDISEHWWNREIRSPKKESQPPAVGFRPDIPDAATLQPCFTKSSWQASVSLEREGNGAPLPYVSAPESHPAGNAGLKTHRISAGLEPSSLWKLWASLGEKVIASPA